MTEGLDAQRGWMWAKVVVAAAATAGALGLSACDDDTSSTTADDGDDGDDPGPDAEDEYSVRGRIGGSELSSETTPAVPGLEVAWGATPNEDPPKDPKDPPQDPGTTPGTDPYAWQCDQDPNWAPCSSCSPTATQQHCDDAITQHCDGVYDDPLCPWICDVDPNYGPCSSCVQDPQSDACNDAWIDWCTQNPSEPYCGDNGDTPPDSWLTPSSLSLEIHQVQFSEDAQGCTDPITVFETDQPKYVDLGNDPELFSVGAPPAGTYPCVIITFSDHIQWSAKQVPACAGDHVQDVYQGQPGVVSSEEVVTMYISTAGDREGDVAPWSPPGLLLEAPHVAGSDVLSSTLVVYAQDRVGYWQQPSEGRDACEMMAPTFGYVTEYK